MLGIGKFFSMNQQRTERVLLRVNQMLRHSRLAGELLKAQDSEDFEERAEQFRHELLDNGCSANLMFERISAFQDLMQHHALLSGMHYFLYTATYLERIFKDKNAMADAESKDKLYKMISEDSNFSLQAEKVWIDKDFVEKVKAFEKALDADGYKGIKLTDSKPFQNLLTAHAFKAGEIYFDVLMKNNLIEVAKRLVR
jgi:hypothetical protein